MYVAEYLNGKKNGKGEEYYRQICYPDCPCCIFCGLYNLVLEEEKKKLNKIKEKELEEEKKKLIKIEKELEEEKKKLQEKEEKKKLTKIKDTELEVEKKNSIEEKNVKIK